MANKQDDHMDLLFFFLNEVKQGISREEEKKVMIEKAINLKLLCDYVVSCSYGDIVLIICMLRDYVKVLDDRKGDDITYQAYYRKKFLDIADRLSRQIEYDYDAALQKCLKKKERESNSDIGEEAMSLAIKYGTKKKEPKKTPDVADAGGLMPAT